MLRGRRTVGGRAAQAALLLIALVVGLVVPVSPASAQAAPGGGGEYTPVAPFRVLDSRPGPTNLGFVGPLAGNQPRTIPVAGVPGSSFFREPVNRYIRFHFAKKESTLQAVGERLLKIRGAR